MLLISLILIYFVLCHSKLCMSLVCLLDENYSNLFSKIKNRNIQIKKIEGNFLNLLKSNNLRYVKSIKK